MDNKDVMAVPESRRKRGDTRRQGDGVEEELEEKLEKVRPQLEKHMKQPQQQQQHISFTCSGRWSSSYSSYDSIF